jgi:hypothetical protein
MEIFHCISPEAHQLKFTFLPMYASRDERAERGITWMKTRTSDLSFPTRFTCCSQLQALLACFSCGCALQSGGHGIQNSTTSLESVVEREGAEEGAVLRADEEGSPQVVAALIDNIATRTH